MTRIVACRKEARRRMFLLSLVVAIFWLGGCALVPEYKTPISKEHEKHDQQRERECERVNP